VRDVGCGECLLKKSCRSRNLEEKLGDDCFDDGGDVVGRFWMILPTRPYMRALQSLVKVYHDSGRIEDSVYVCFDSIPL
jgi:hypothetical protein